MKNEQAQDIQINLEDLNLQDVETLGESDTYGLPEGGASLSVGRGCGSCSVKPALNEVQ
ncbi:hypothetical protein [Deinococcus misasensis]|uniref:hypothetical protein n=1 Tax=Deinococcus misasensis TaxID=392413 RepID=UPI000AB59D25|nr:hypothetical protein [Deinococcus misasensis]